MLTVESLKKCLPKSLKTNATQELVDSINAAGSNEEERRQIQENVLGYMGILGSGNYKTEDYIAAVKYVTYKLMGRSNIVAYTATFPARYSRLVALGTSEKDIAAYVTAYNKNKLVNLILEQSLIPTWIINQDVYQKAINTQAEIMLNSKSDMARVQAANSILTHLKRPEAVAPLVNINIKETSGMSELKDLLGSLAHRQKDLIKKGGTAKEIAEQRLVIEGSAVEVEG